MPAALRFWDGSEIGPGEEGSCPDVIVLRNKRAMTYVVTRPAQLGVARASSPVTWFSKGASRG